jgi:hypothetical protein
MAAKVTGAAKITGKQRAVRIPLDYYKHLDALTRWKLALAFLASVLALGWWFGGDAWSHGQTALRVSHGPVAAVHATWEQRCEVCHVPFQPIGSETWPVAHLERLSVSLASPDAKCQECHRGPPHHANQITKEVPSCSSCHRDHRGRDASLVRSPDRDCTTCHGNLTQHIQTGARSGGYEGTIHGFHLDHPEFAILRPPGKTPEETPRDPSNLLFNHAVHMTQGLKQGYTLSKITDKDRDRYRGREKDGTPQPDTGVVQLECASCHVLDPGDSASGGSPSGRGGPGDYMMPIVFENQCRACHPLDISRPGAGRRMVRAEDEDRGGEKPLPSLVVPHGHQPAAIHEFLSNGIAAQLLTTNPALGDRRRMPGPITREAQTVREAIEASVLQAEQGLYQGKQTCTECHLYDPPEPGPLQKGQVPKFKVLETRVPTVWFPHAVFDHTAHRTVECRQCHEKAYATDAHGSPKPDASTTSDDVMLPGIDKCRQCHEPAKLVDGKPRGGVRFDCVECHRYHNGDRPDQGAGALARGARRRVSIEDFLLYDGSSRPAQVDATAAIQAPVVTPVQAPSATPDATPVQSPAAAPGSP